VDEVLGKDRYPEGGVVFLKCHQYKVVGGTLVTLKFVNPNCEFYIYGYTYIVLCLLRYDE